jgi:transcriptional regulator with XRE-family HTH domain
MSDNEPGKTFRELREKAGLNISVLARRANTSNGTIRKAEAGRPIRGDIAQRICRVLSLELHRGLTNSVTPEEAGIEIIP